MFAPRVKWEALEGIVEDVKTAAESYEKAFNEIVSTETNNENFQEVSDPNIRHRSITNSEACNLGSA